MSKKGQKEKDDLTRKIERLYQNYGIDTSNMEEDELDRLKSSYKKKAKSIDEDLKKSEIHKDKYTDDIV